MPELRAPLDPGPVAIGTWSGGRFMHFGAALDDERFRALITPDKSIRTILTADVYGAGEADAMLGRAIAGLPRDQMCIVGAVGHDFYDGRAQRPQGLPAVHRPGPARTRRLRRLPADGDRAQPRALRDRQL